MNGKGAYSGTIAVVAIVVLIAVSFSSGATLNTEDAAGKAKAIVELKAEFQQARYLLDKTASDAIADSAEAGGCDFDSTEIAGILLPYFRNTLEEAGLENCGMANSSVSGNRNNITIKFNLNCTKELSGMQLQYKKDSIQLTKRAAYENTGTGCNVDVRDSDSSVCEVDTISAGSGSNLCTAS
ncbi:MAG: hypothetical protein JW744_03465 [Candidatus Diapherotrites archaeon]|uniref:Uncharacterized protein n=1 Tax=Candidatus Iainarchaeum sp. TaxID=3101447 RepID=A0A939C4S3_9ARCH|nr:hypothetical protein [Candidatus Diapherotrites archaeon]